MLNLKICFPSLPAPRRVLVGFGLTVLACRALAGPEQAPASPTSAAPDATPPIVQNTEEPQETEAAPAGVEVSCGSVFFRFDPALADGANCATVAAVPNSGDFPYWEIVPEHIRVTFDGYVLADRFHDPRILVYPVAEFESLNEFSARPIGDLQALLEARPQVFEEPLPFLPPFNAGQIFRTQVRYLEFKGGAGVRFLTLYGQALRVINNDELFYTFQGLTQDDAFYVAVVLPASHPSLPAEGDLAPEEYDAFAENLEAYLKATEQSLEAEAAASFVPDLGLLDAMIQSLEVR